MKYLVRDCDPNTGEPDDDGYNDEYVVCEFSKSIHTDENDQWPFLTECLVPSWKI